MARRMHEDPPRKNKFARERRDIAHLCSMYRFLNKCIFFPYLPLDFTCDFLSLLADVFDEAFEGAGFDSTVPPFFGPWNETNVTQLKSISSHGTLLLPPQPTKNLRETKQIKSALLNDNLFQA